MFFLALSNNHTDSYCIVDSMSLCPIGKVKVCKTFYTGSSPVRDSKKQNMSVFNFFKTEGTSKPVLKVNGVEVPITGEDVVISISGDLGLFQVKVDGNLRTVKGGSFSIQINGNVSGDVETSQGKIECGDVGGNVRTSQGSVSCKNVTGGVETSMGSVDCENVGGNVKTGMGNIKYKK